MVVVSQKSYDISGAGLEQRARGAHYLKLENVLDAIKLLLESVEGRSLAIEPGESRGRPH